MAQLSTVKPGDPITAEQWNTLVAAIQGAGPINVGPITVPNLFGLTLGNAVAIITLPSTQLTRGNIIDSLGNSVDPTVADSKPLIVLNQMPAAGTNVFAGTAVNLVVAPKPGSAPPPPQIPTISGFVPTQAPISTQLEIDGDNLNGGSATFAGVPGIPAGGSTKFKLFVVVPPGIPGAPVNPGDHLDVTVIVTTPLGTSQGSKVTILPPPTNPLPTITSFNPTSGVVGGNVTIAGTGFDTTAGNNTVHFDNVPATPSTASATTLSVTIPTGINGLNSQFDSRNVPITVTVGGQASPSKDYNITQL